MASTTWSPDLRRPIYTTRVLCEVANERGVAASEILAGTGVGPGDLADPDAVVVAADEMPDARGFFLERDVAGIVMTVSGFALPVLARYADQLTVEATFDEGAVAPLLEMLPNVTREFGRAHNRVHFPRAMFDEPLPQSDRHTLEMCVAQCDVLMQRSEQRRGITAVVRTKLFRESGRFPTLSDVAAELDVHPRALRRQLTEEGTSFRALLNEARSTLAVDLLCNVGLTVEEVSKRLGYTDASTFCHAFKRWHGVPPSAYPRAG